MSIYFLIFQTRTDHFYNDADIEGSIPIKQPQYTMNPMKLQYLREEIQYLLDNDFIEPCQSDWSSPCILVPKPDGAFRMCTDYRKVNSVTKTDSFPMPRMDDCIDNIGQANINKIRSFKMILANSIYGQN